MSWPKSGPLHDHFGIIVDASGYGGSHDGAAVTRATFLVGGRGIYRVRQTGHVVSATVLAGVVRSQVAGVKDNNFASSIGAGYEYALGDYTQTGQQSAWGVRVQSDYVFQNSGDGFARTSFGVVYRFKQAPPTPPKP